MNWGKKDDQMWTRSQKFKTNAVFKSCDSVIVESLLLCLHLTNVPLERLMTLLPGLDPRCSMTNTIWSQTAMHHNLVCYNSERQGQMS